MIEQRIGIRIEQLRRSRRLSQKDVYQRAHVSRNTVYRLECGNVPSIDLLKRIADVLGEEVWDIVQMECAKSGTYPC